MFNVKFRVFLKFLWPNKNSESRNAISSYADSSQKKNKKKLLFLIVQYMFRGKDKTVKERDLVIFEDTPVNNHTAWRDLFIDKVVDLSK